MATTQEQALEEVETELHPNDRLAEMFTVYSASSTRKAIADAKRVYAEQYGMETENVIGRKWDSGWDQEKETAYLTIAVSVVRNYD